MFWSILCAILMGIPLFIFSMIGVMGDLLSIKIMWGMEAIIAYFMFNAAAEYKLKSVFVFTFICVIMTAWGIMAGFILPLINTNG